MADRDGDMGALVDTFGPMAVRLLGEQPLQHAWRISFLANFFTGPFYRRLAETHGLSRPEFVILLGLSHEPRALARDFCLATGLPKNSLSRAVSQLLERGLITAETQEEDRRGKLLSITPQGARLLDEVVPVALARQSAMRAALTAEEAEIFDRLLLKLIRAMPDWAEAD